MKEENKMKSMKYIYKLSAALTLLSGLTFLSGCSKESAFEKTAVGEAEINFKPAVRSAASTKSDSGKLMETGVFTCEEGITIPFTHTVENAAASFATKGDLTNTSGETMALNEAGVSRFRICAINEDNSVFIPCSKNVNYVDGKWQAERTYVWKEAGDKRFFACAGFDETVTMSVTDDGSVDFKTKLVIPDKAEEQKDFIFAQTISDGDYDNDGVIDGTIALQFDHICTSVIFKCGTITGVDRIKSISIEGVTGCREYEVIFDVTGSLTEETTVTDTYTKTVYTIVDSALPAVGEMIGEPFILVPQGLEGQPVTLRIHATVYGRDYELISKIESGSWEAGKTNVYTIGYTAQFDPADDDPLCFTSEGPQTVCFHKKQADGSVANLEYSADGANWTAWADPEIPVEFNGTLYLRGLNANGFYAGEDTLAGVTEGFVFGDQSVPVTLSGDQMSIIDYRVKVQVPGRGCFAAMYAQQTCIKSAADLKLPATELTEYCYCAMFSGCSNMEYGPALPAMKMRTDCYGAMFSGCESLKECPALPATELASECYALMFFKCTSLEETCALPAMSVKYQSYGNMFSQCPKLEKACALPATELAENCYEGMFNGCENLTEAPAILPAAELAKGCYTRMFHKCTSLETAPVLPAAVLEYECYQDMFKGCSSLTYIQMLATDISATDCLDEWVKNVADHGTFVKDGGMNDIPVNSVSGIPVGWTVANPVQANCTADNWRTDEDYNRTLDFTVSPAAQASLAKAFKSKSLNSRIAPAATMSLMSQYEDIAFCCLSADMTETYLNLETFTKAAAAGDGTCVYERSTPFFLPDESAVYNYMAVAPANVNGLVTTIDGIGTHLDYTIPKNAAAQTDFAKGYNFGYTGNSVPMNFSHALAALRFKKGAFGIPGMEITEIRISNIADYGEYRTDNGLGWYWTTSVKDASSDFVLTFDESNPLTEDGSIIFVLPQASKGPNADAVITLVTNLTEAGSPVTLTYPLTSDYSWHEGCIFDYTVNVSVQSE